MPKVISICIRAENGTKELSSCKLISGKGIEGDSIRDSRRSISIVDEQFIVNKTTNANGFCANNFKANLKVEGLDISKLSLDHVIIINQSKIQITSSGKKCFVECPEYGKAQPCELHKHVAFAMVICDGIISVGDEVIT